MLDRLDDTIVAISSSPGYGPLGIVRLSGPAAIPIVDQMAATKERLTASPGSRWWAGEVMIGRDIGLPALFYLFRTPHSYTRQDLVEIHTVGSPAALETVRRRAVDLGALPAQPGEFTARAFLNGAMDLGSAEAVAALIRAQSDTQIRAARRMMDGTLAKAITALRDQVAELLALVEADIDFAEEPIEFITPGALRDRLTRIGERLNELLAGSTSAHRFDVLPSILLLGPPNAGKSSLMNRLSGTSRAICAAAAGTTRDILSAPIRLGRGEALLLDSAGVDMWERCARTSTEAILAEARARAVATAEQADLVCVVFDLTHPRAEEITALVGSLDVGRVVVAANKSDLISEPKARAIAKRLAAGLTGPVCIVSALEGTGIEKLRATCTDALGSAATTMLSESVLVSERQQAAISDAAASLGRAVSLSESAGETVDCADVLAFELREVLDSLGAVTGEVTTDDLLARVFADFCIGK